MRKKLTLTLFLFWNGSFGQTKEPLPSISDCEILTSIALNRLEHAYLNNTLDATESILNEWIRPCGITEFTQRFVILKNIMNNKPALTDIHTYFDNGLQYVFSNRIEDSKRIDFGYIYTNSKAYYGYVPLRHPMDSISIALSLQALKTKVLTADEKLICILFSGELDTFREEMKKNEYRKSYIKETELKKFRDYANNGLAYVLYAGYFTSIRTDNIFSYSPMVGLIFSSPLRNKVVVELGVKFRFNVKDGYFDYTALGTTNQVNSDVSIFLGTLVGYKIYERDNLIVIPKFGVGLESVDTGLSKKKKNTNETTYYNLETIHLSLGLSAMTPILKKSYMGIGVNYHYCPYQLDNNLRTKFNNNLVSTEMFWRF